jgi:hypothetical protein
MTVRLQQWARSDLRSAAGGLLVVVGAVALGLGIAGVGRAARLHEALSYVVSGGIGGLFLLVCGLMLRGSAQAREEWQGYAELRAAAAAGTATAAMGSEFPAR